MQSAAFNPSSWMRTAPAGSLTIERTGESYRNEEARVDILRENVAGDPDATGRLCSVRVASMWRTSAQPGSARRRSRFRPGASVCDVPGSTHSRPSTRSGVSDECTIQSNEPSNVVPRGWDRCPGNPAGCAITRSRIGFHCSKECGRPHNKQDRPKPFKRMTCT